MKVALYGRKSKGQPATVQMARLRAAAEAQGHEVVLEAQDVASGRDPNRPGWDKVLTHVRAGWVRAVWITKTDRAMRNARHYLAVVEDELEPRGCLLYVLDQPMACVTSYSDPLAKAFRGIGALFAQLEADLADERSNEGHYVQDGRTYGPSGTPVGRPAEYGDGHKFRIRNGRPEHDRARCPPCRGETGGLAATVSATPGATRVGKPNGSPASGGDA